MRRSYHISNRYYRNPTPRQHSLTVSRYFFIVKRSKTSNSFNYCRGFIKGCTSKGHPAYGECYHTYLDR